MTLTAFRWILSQICRTSNAKCHCAKAISKERYPHPASVVSGSAQRPLPVSLLSSHAREYIADAMSLLLAVPIICKLQSLAGKINSEKQLLCTHSQAGTALSLLASFSHFLLLFCFFIYYHLFNNLLGQASLAFKFLNFLYYFDTISSLITHFYILFILSFIIESNKVASHWLFMNVFVFHDRSLYNS